MWEADVGGDVFKSQVGWAQVSGGNVESVKRPQVGGKSSGRGKARQGTEGEMNGQGGGNWQEEAVDGGEEKGK